MNSAESIFHILLMLCFHPHEVPPKRFGQIYRQHGNAVFAAFCVAHRYLRELEIDIFYPVRYLRSLVLMYRLPHADFKYFSR